MSLLKESFDNNRTDEVESTSLSEKIKGLVERLIKEIDLIGRMEIDKNKDYNEEKEKDALDADEKKLGWRPKKPL